MHEMFINIFSRRQYKLWNLQKFCSLKITSYTVAPPLKKCDLINMKENFNTHAYSYIVILHVLEDQTDSTTVLDM